MSLPDSYDNFTYGAVTVAPSPALSGLTMSVSGTRPSPPYNAVVFPAGAVRPVAGEAEIVRVTADSSGSLTLSARNVETGSVARTILVGDQFVPAITKKALTDLALPGIVPIVAVSANYTALPGDYTILVSTASGAVTITVPQEKGRILNIKKTSTDANAIKVKGESGNVEGAATLESTATTRPAWTIQSDGTNAWVV